MQETSFELLLSELNDGLTRNNMDEKLKELIAAVRNTGKGGSLSLKINIKPASRGEVNKLVFIDEVKATIPDRDRSSTYMFVNKSNELSLHDPNQTVMPFEEVAEAQKNVVEVPAKENKIVGL